MIHMEEIKQNILCLFVTLDLYIYVCDFVVNFSWFDRGESQM